jgi:hypothetical protein
LIALGCGRQPATETVVFVDTIDSLESILTRDGVAWDPGVSHDGHGAIRIEATRPTTVRLAEIHPANAEQIMLTYRAHLRTEGLVGQAYLEMWCSIPGKGEFFSRALQAPVSGTTGWVTQETSFFLEKGHRLRQLDAGFEVTVVYGFDFDDVRKAVNLALSFAVTSHTINHSISPLSRISFSQSTKEKSRYFPGTFVSVVSGTAWAGTGGSSDFSCCCGAGCSCGAVCCAGVVPNSLISGL